MLFCVQFRALKFWEKLKSDTNFLEDVTVVMTDVLVIPSFQQRRGLMQPSRECSELLYVVEKSCLGLPTDPSWLDKSRLDTKK